jgi:alkylation response protein AidB-like acyl-CoA dehydrogenase
VSEPFRRELRAWLTENVPEDLRGKGGPGREHEAYEQRLAFNRRLAAAGWSGLGWPVEHGGVGASLAEQVAFHEEYARADAPARVDRIGETLVGPALIAFGTDEQQRRFLPRIRAVDELWCQGFSEPGAGSDLAALSTRAHVDGDQWVINGQKVWTSLAQYADWCFLLARTTPPTAGVDRHAALSMLLVPMRQPGVVVRPIRQLTGTSEFNEVFFDEARTDRSLVLGGVGRGWRVATALLARERGAATLGQQIGFQRELAGVAALVRDTGAGQDPAIRERLTRAYVGLSVLRSHTLRTLAAGTDATAAQDAAVVKLLWSGWHRGLGELAMAVQGAAGTVVPGEFDEWQRLFLFSRAETIYGGSDEIQRNTIATRTLGLPRQARP